MFDDEDCVAARFELLQHGQQGFGVGRVQPRRRLVQNVDDAEQAGPQLGGDPQPLHFAGGKCWRRAPQAQVSEAQFQQYFDPLQQITGHRHGNLSRFPGIGRGPGRAGVGKFRGGADNVSQFRHWHRIEFGNIPAGECNRQRVRLQPRAIAKRTRSGLHEAQDFPAHGLAFGFSEGVQHVAPGADELALIRFSDPVALRDHVNHRLVFGEENPVAALGGQVAPGDVDVVPERCCDVPQALALPCPWPAGDGAVADA